MAQLNITLDTDLLKDLFSFEGRDKAFASLMQTILNQVLEHQVSEQVGAKYYERTEGRQAYRNGYRERTMRTRVGTLTLTVPRLRDGNFSTELFERYQRNEQALVLAMMEMVVNGVSTRKVSAITEELCGSIDREAAALVRDRILTEYGKLAPKACELLEEAFDDVTAILRLPLHIRRRLRTSNCIERVNEEIRRRERVIRIFPNVDSLHRLIGALLMDIHEDWQTGRKYLSLLPGASVKTDTTNQTINPTVA